MKHCKKCGCETERYADGDCKPCADTRSAAYRAANLERLRAKDAAYRAANREKRKAKDAAYRAANRDKVLAKAAAYRADNRDNCIAYGARWRAANREQARAAIAAWAAATPDKLRAYAQNRRARKRERGGKLSPDIAARLLKLQKGKCACCRQKLGDDYHLDHIVPLALGGANTDENMQLLRAVCNLQKSTKHPAEFMRQRGFLL